MVTRAIATIKAGCVPKVLHVLNYLNFLLEFQPYADTGSALLAVLPIIWAF